MKSKLEERVSAILTDLTMYTITGLYINNRENKRYDQKSFCDTDVVFTIKHLLEEDKYPKVKIDFNIIKDHGISDFIKVEIVDNYKLDTCMMEVETENTLYLEYPNAESLYRDLCSMVRDVVVSESLMKYIL